MPSVSLAAVGLWLGSLELDRIFAPEAERVAEIPSSTSSVPSAPPGFWAVNQQ